jgi:ribonucleoside-diphosphate reductase alpha chain
MAAARSPFIDQSQSLNIHMEGANAAKLTALHFTAWKLGLKTGMYYLRTKAATDATKFTVEQPAVASANVTSSALEMRANGDGSVSAVSATPSTMAISDATAADLVCSLDNPNECISCGS